MKFYKFLNGVIYKFDNGFLFDKKHFFITHTFSRLTENANA